MGINSGIPNISGLWAGTKDGEPYWERIEQCGDRIIITTGCHTHDYRHIDGSIMGGYWGWQHNNWPTVMTVEVGQYDPTVLIFMHFGERLAIKRSFINRKKMMINENRVLSLLDRTDRAYGYQECDMPVEMQKNPELLKPEWTKYLNATPELKYQLGLAFINMIFWAIFFQLKWILIKIINWLPCRVPPLRKLDAVLDWSS